MRVIQTKNDTIRLIFNPKTDGLCLSDFLIVRDGEDNFLGQIVEIYDDKFNAEENVATIRLVYRILPDQQVVPYDNFTPSRECEIARIKIEEIEKCVNIEKETVPFGLSAKNDKVVNVSLDFFNHNPVVFADKLDEVNCAFENIAQKLKSHKKVVAIDYTGNLNIKNAKRIKAINDFKLPLDFYSLDYIWEKALGHATLDVQTELEDTFIELKNFVESSEDKYIPFPRFIKVIEQQYKATPALGLKMLLNKLKRFWNEGLFSRSKKEFQAISKAMAKEDAVIIDLSNLKLEWHKDFLEFVIRQIKDTESYLLLRFNENNSNPEIINDLYLNNPKLSIISSVSYGFAKLPHLMEHVRNYILYKTLNPRRDFGFANPQIGALNPTSFVIFGEDTKDFMFVLKNYIFDEEDLHKFEDKKIYIDLNLELEEMTSVELAGGDFELKNVHIQPSQKTPQGSRLAEEVSLDEVMPEVPADTEKKTDETADVENVSAATEEAEKGYELLPVDEIEEPASEELSREEESDVSEEELKEETEEPEELPYTLEEVDDSTRGIIPDIVSNHLDEAVNEATNETANEYADESAPEAENAEMAELIEASLKNDEEYIKEVEKEAAKDNSGNAENVNAAPIPEIPVAEEDLDYFINPEEVNAETNTENVQDEDEVITSDMIENAAMSEKINEELANEIEAQAKEEVAAEKESENKEQASVKPVNLDEDSLEDLQKEAHTAHADDNVKKTLEEDSNENLSGANQEPSTEENTESAAPQNLEAVVNDSLNVEPVEETEEGQTEEKHTTEVEPAAEAQSAEEQAVPEVQPVQKVKQKPEEAIIIVKEKPILKIDDFTEEEPKAVEPAVLEPETVDEDGVSLKELANKSIEARFEEVIGETKKAETSKNRLQINENVSIDLNKIKNQAQNTESTLPIFNNEEEDEEPYEYEFMEGMKVGHQKYGAGSILKVVKYSNRCLLQIEFEESGKRLLDPKIAKIKPL